MNFVKYVLIFSASILLIIVIGGLLLPSQYKIERNIYINSSISEVEDYIIDLRKWEQWSYMSSRKDTTIVFNYQQNNIGPYSSAKWKSDFMGEGILRIYDYKPAKNIYYEILIQENEHKINGIFFIDSTDKGINLKWMDYGDLGINPIARIFGLFMENYIGQDQENSLKELKKIIEKQ